MSGFTPKYCSIDTWCELSGMSRRVTYEELGAGHLRAKKLNAKTLIDVDHGLAYLSSLPDAEIKAPKERVAA